MNSRIATIILIILALSIASPSYGGRGEYDFDFSGFDGVEWGIDYKSAGMLVEWPTFDKSQGGFALPLPGTKDTYYNAYFYVRPTRRDSNGTDRKFFMRHQFLLYFIGDGSNDYRMAVGTFIVTLQYGLLSEVREDIFTALTERYGSPHDEVAYEFGSDYSWDFDKLRILFVQSRHTKEEIESMKRAWVEPMFGRSLNGPILRVLFLYKPLLEEVGYNSIPSLPITYGKALWP